MPKAGYANRPRSTTSNVNGTDTSDIISCGVAIIPSYIACTYCASGINHDTRFIHVFGSNLVTDTNYKSINTLHINNSTSTNNNNNLSEPELEISSSSFIPNTVYGSSSTFAASSNYIYTPGNLTAPKIFDPSKLDRNYIIVDDHKFSVYLKDNADSMDSASFGHSTESRDVLDAKESYLLKDFPKVQNPIGIKGPASLNFHTSSNILLPNFTIILEAEPSDVVKFAISSGAVNQFFKVSL